MVSGRLVLHIQMRRLQPSMALVPRIHQGVQTAAYQQGALHRVLRLAREKHLLDIEAQVAKVGDRAARASAGPWPVLGR